MAERSAHEASPSLLPPGPGSREPAQRRLADAAGSMSQESGRPLDGATRDFMQSRFARDFSQVRVHDGARAAASAQALQADAFSLGSHIGFASGRYAPQSSGGQQLLAHELAHVAQQDSAPAAPRSGLRLGGEGDAAEAAADSAATAIGQGRAVGAVGRSDAGVLRRAPCGQYPSGSLLSMRPCTPVSAADINSTAGERALIHAAEPLIRNNPSLQRIVDAYNNQVAIHGSAQVQVALPEGASLSADSSGRLVERMFDIQSALSHSGIPLAAIDIKLPLSPPRLLMPGRLPRPAQQETPKLSLGMAGHLLAPAEPVEVTVMQRAAPPPVLPRLAPSPPAYGPQPAPGGLMPFGTLPPMAAPSPLAGLSGIKLEIKLGPLLLKLPKEVQVKLDHTLRGGRKFEFEISYEAPGKGKLKFAVNGNRTVDFEFEVSSDTDTKNGATRGGAGFKFSSAKKICHSKGIDESLRLANAALLKANKAAMELETLLGNAPERKLVPASADGTSLVVMPPQPAAEAAATGKPKPPPTDLDIASKAGEVAAALKEAIDAAEGAQKKCTEVSRWEIGISGEHQLYRGDDYDPLKTPATDIKPSEVMLKFKYLF